LPKTMSETLAGCETASWRRSDAQLPLQVYRSYLDSFRRSDRGSNPLPPWPQAKKADGTMRSSFRMEPVFS
jgi:hypothetical protein